jgi:hypothetical protein
MNTKHSTKSFEERVGKLWEESKAAYKKDVDDRVYLYCRDFRKWRIFTMMIMLSLIHPRLHLNFYTKRARIRRKVHRILMYYIPPIEDQLELKLEVFNLWEEENKGPGRSAFTLTICRERDVDDQLEDLVIAMMLGIKSIIDYDKWFHPIPDPRKFIENPYPGYLDIRRALNYCDNLLWSFR